MPLSPISGSFILRTLLSSGCQHSMPANLQMNPSVLLLKFHEVKTFSGSSIEDLKALRQSMSLWMAFVKVVDKRMKRHVVTIDMVLGAMWHVLNFSDIQENLGFQEPSLKKIAKNKPYE